VSNPLFDTLDSTLKRQRLTNLDPSHTVIEQLDLVVDDARGEFYTRLGLSRMQTLTGITPAMPPATDDEHLYLLAQVTEQKMIRHGLLGYLSTLTKEGQGGRIYQEWNDVSAFRDMGAERIENERKRLWDEIDRAFGFLSGELLPGKSPRIRASAIGSTLNKQYRKVGFSLYASPAYLFHFSLDTDTLIDE
jgi:hypothetical protein